MIVSDTALAQLGDVTITGAYHDHNLLRNYHKRMVCVRVYVYRCVYPPIHTHTYIYIYINIGGNGCRRSNNKCVYI